jgi:hypothetical protein
LILLSITFLPNILNYFNTDMTSKNSKLKLIAVNQRNYLALKDLGKAGDSFNDVVGELLKLRSGGQRRE